MNDTDDQEVAWTNKLPALVIGVVLLIAGLYMRNKRWRPAIIGGTVLILMGCGFIGYSMTIKEWCAAVNPQSAFSSAFSTSFHGCLRAKGWLEF